MNYIILGKATKKGTVNDDSADLSVYFELGWEVVGSRIDIINKINSKEIDFSNTTLVTLDDRKFMYTKFYDKVISFDEFNSIKLSSNDYVEDWPVKRNFSFLNAYNGFINNETKQLKTIDRDHDLLFDGYDLKGTIFESINKPYVVLALRYRDHNNYKNADETFFKNLVLEIRKNVCHKIFVVGYGSEKFCEENDCVYINRLVDYVFLIKNNLCMSLIAQSTGTICLALMCSNTHIHLLDHSGCSELDGDNAVLGGRCVQLFKKGLTPYYTLSNEIIPDIIKNIKKLT
jgi:hypothetical protein